MVADVASAAVLADEGVTWVPDEGVCGGAVGELEVSRLVASQEGPDLASLAGMASRRNIRPRRDPMSTCVAIPVLTALSVAQAAVQPACEGWTTEDFWRTADPARVKECLAAGYSVHDRLGRSWTVLHMAAAFSDDPEVIAVLVEAGADLEASWPPLNRTPLHTAARHNRNPEIVRLLLRYGADDYAVNGPGRTPLHLAALFSENPAVVEELVKVTDVNIRAKGGETPLHDAARRKPNHEGRVGNPNPGIVEILLTQGADLSAEALDGSYPLAVGRRRSCRRPDPERDAATGSDQRAVPAVGGDEGGRGSGRARTAGIPGWRRRE